ETLDLVRQSAQMRFRAFLFQGEAGPIDPRALAEFEEQQGGAGEDPEAEHAPEGQAEELQEAEADGEDAPAEVTAEEIEDAARRAADLDGDGEISDEPESEPANGSDQAWITEQVWYDFYTLDCTDSANLIGGGGDDPDAPLVAWDKDGTSKYILAPMEIPGTDIATATSGLAVNSAGAPTGDYAVSITFNKDGTEKFRDVTTRLYNEHRADGTNRFAAVLDGLVTIAPAIDNGPIPNGER